MTFVHEAVLGLDEEMDEGAPGAAITTMLCGSFEHTGPCPLAPHHTATSRDGSQLLVRVLFATEPDHEPAVRAMIIDALASGGFADRSGQSASWRLLHHATGTVRADERSHAARLANGGIDRGN